MTHDVFISYRRDGGEYLARLIKDALKNKGLSVFMDVEDLKAGRFDTALFGKIEEATDVIVILTPGCLDRCKNEDDWLRQEIQHAIECERNIVPIIARGFQMPLPAALPSDIAKVTKYHALTPAPELFEASIDRLVSNFLLSKPPRGQSAPRLEHVSRTGTHSKSASAQSHRQDERLEQSGGGRRESQTLFELKKTAEVGHPAKERTRAIRMIGQVGGQSEIHWLTDLIFRSTRRATFKEAAKQIAELGGIDAVHSLKAVAENHKDDWAKAVAVELLLQLDKLSDPDWFKRFLKTESYFLKFQLLEALAKEGWLGRLDIGQSQGRQLVEDLRQMAETEEHPDVRHRLISIVAHLSKDAPWTREWLLQKAKESEEGYYRIHAYAIGLSVWNGDETFVQALNECPKDSTGHDGKMFVQWAKEGDWKRYHFHMGGWGPTM